MRKPGERSREGDAYLCSNHKDEKDKYFFKVLVGDFRERLAIPDKFVRHFRGLIASSVKLESRCGHTFDVEVSKNLGKLVLGTGWEAFVTAHDLNMGDFLVFKYDGTSRFKVLIFDLSCCEKMPPCIIKRSHIHGRETREEHIEISSSSEDFAIKSHVSKRKAWKQRMGSMNVKTSPSTSPSNTSGFESPCRTNLRGMASSEDEEAHSVPSYLLPQRASLDSMQKKKVKERLRTICSEIPIYVCVVKKTNIHTNSNSNNSPAMEFSTKYSKLYLPFKSRRLILQCHGVSWEVHCHIQVRKNESPFKKIFKGWPRFARDNNLQLGDICLFEPLKTKKDMMNVHIIRKE